MQQIPDVGQTISRADLEALLEALRNEPIGDRRELELSEARVSEPYIVARFECADENGDAFKRVS